MGTIFNPKKSPNKLWMQWTHKGKRYKRSTGFRVGQEELARAKLADIERRLYESKLRSDFPELRDQKKQTAKWRKKSAFKEELVGQEARCEVCNWAFGGFRVVDAHHVIPVAAGGPDIPSNLVVLCPNHHRVVHVLWGNKGYTGPRTKTELIAAIRQREAMVFVAPRVVEERYDPN